ncbi:MAG: hypothetical protein AABY22_12580 [Nanoarchaeota archaeon]
MEENIVKCEKICKKCLIEKDYSEFNKAKGAKDKHHPWCKGCLKERNNTESAKAKRKEWKRKNKDRVNEQLKQYKKRHAEKQTIYRKKYYDKNREKILKRYKNDLIKNKDKYHQKAKIYRENNKDKTQAAWKKYYETHEEELKIKRKQKYWKDINKNREKQRVRAKRDREKRRLMKIEYRNNNREKVNATRRKYGEKNRDKFLKQYREPKRNLDARISSFMRQCLKGNKAGRRWESLVNYSLDELYQHIESQFTEGMTWEKLSQGEIVIDHILPRELFEYKYPEEEQFKICWSLKNLRPLWFENNSKKSDFLPDGRQARHLMSEEKIEYLISLGHNLIKEKELIYG